ncbi:MAG TPA: BTAD domain-containing putative transcriptional regulator [Burkholderiaceae bacterium]|nr:BTAD domain-containing putative transcriptional regulator [Burkholderiaceae bacterium]
MQRLAKLTRPKLRRTAARPRLFSLLDQCLEAAAIWVIGPPGGGKTSLIASFIDARKLVALWVQIDETDRDPATFFYFLREAALALDPRRRRAPLPLLTPEYQADLAAYSRLFFRELFARLRQPAVLVLDSYHRLPPSSKLHELLAVALAEAPAGITVVFASRIEPPAEYAELRNDGRLTTIDWFQLRLRPEETRAIAALRAVRDKDTLEAMHRHAAGWPAALALMIEADKTLGSRGAGRHGVALPSAAEAQLFDFYANEVFSEVGADTRDLLTHSAILPRMNIELTAQVTGQPGTEATLLYLYRRGLLVERVGTDYQYHDLARAFLLGQLHYREPRSAVDALRKRAGGLLEHAQQFEEAFALYRDAEYWAGAARVTARHAPRLLADGRALALLEWLNELPPHLVDEDGWLCLWHGLARCSLAPIEARVPLQQAYQLFARADDPTGQALACAATIHSYYLEFGDLAPLDPWIDRLLRLADEHEAVLGAHARLQLTSALLFALVFRRPAAARIEQTVEQFFALIEHDAAVQKETLPTNEVVAAAAIGMACLVQLAEVDACTRLAQAVTPHLQALDLTPANHALWLQQSGFDALFRGDDALAAQRFDAALALCADHALTAPLLTVAAHFGNAIRLLYAGQAAQADAQRACNAGVLAHGRWIHSATDALLSTIVAAQRGEWTRAVELARKGNDFAARGGVVWQRFYALLQLGIAMAEAGRLDRAQEALARARGLVAETAYERFSDECDLVEAYVAWRSRDSAACTRHLRMALASRASAHALSFLRLQPYVLPHLCAYALQAGIEVERVRHLIEALRLRPPSASPPGFPPTLVPDTWPWPLRVYTLGRFEILRPEEAVDFGRKTPRKALALLKALIAFGGTQVDSHRLLDALWNDEELDLAERALAAAFDRLHGLLGDALTQQDGRLTLDRERVWVDAWAFESTLNQCDGADDATAATFTAIALALFGGDFLAPDEAEPWSAPLRERLRERFVDTLAHHAQRLADGGRNDEAIRWYRRGLEVDPAVEAFYQGLMRCYEAIGRLDEAIDAYRCCKEMLSATRSAAPSPATERLYQGMVRDA